jgi:hypothetical protein
MTDLYEILQVSPRADPEVIEAAYRRLVRAHAPPPGPAWSEDPRLIGLQLAYETLRDPARRAAYDRRLLAAIGQHPPPGPAPSAPPPVVRRRPRPARRLGTGAAAWDCLEAGLGLAAGGLCWAAAGLLSLAVLAWVALVFAGGLEAGGTLLRLARLLFLPL